MLLSRLVRRILVTCALTCALLCISRLVTTVFQVQPSWSLRDEKVSKFIGPLNTECPETLAASFHYPYYNSGNHSLNISTLNDVYARLTHCHSIRALDLLFTESGCVITGKDEWAFRWRVGDRFPPLEALSLTGYDWNDIGPPSYLHYRQPAPSAVRWRTAMDWSQLQRLRISRPPEVFVDTFQGQLTGLQEMTWGPSLGEVWQAYGDALCDRSEEDVGLRAKYEQFIEALPPLKRLQISGTGRYLNLTRMLARHGDTLQYFGLHEFEGACKDTHNVSRPHLTNEELRKLEKSAPNLEQLSIDLPRHQAHGVSDWPWNALDVLSQYPRLSDLKIGLELEDKTKRLRNSWCRPHPLMKPELNSSEALRMFRHLRRRDQAVQVERLTLAAGDEQELGVGLPVCYPDEDYERVIYECGTAQLHASGERLCCKPVHRPMDVLLGEVNRDEWVANNTYCDGYDLASEVFNLNQGNVEELVRLLPQEPLI